MLSLFVNKLNRASNGKPWNPTRFQIDGPSNTNYNTNNNTNMIMVQEEDDSEEDEASYYLPQGPFTNNTPAFAQLDSVGPELTGYLPPTRQTRENFRQVIKPQETLNLRVNPIDNLESSYGVKTGPTAPQQLKEEWSNRYCEDAIPSKYLTEATIGSYELMGLNQAQRRSRPMGEGVPMFTPAVPVNQLNESTFGKTHIEQYSTVNNEIYHQRFATLGATPAVYTGIYTDPLTGIEYDTYESAMPPPDGDYYDMAVNPAKNRLLDVLQGGWSNNTPIPPRQEILEGDWNQGYDRTVNTFGGPGSFGDVLRCRQLDNFERSTRFTMNDFTPDNEAPELEGIPANVDGIYGNVKVRFLPNLPGTNRGHGEETTFRTGVQGQTLHDQHVAQEYTRSPQCIAPLDYTGPVDGSFGTYGTQERSEYNPSHRFTGTEVNDELMSHGVGLDTTGVMDRSDYNPANKFTGTEVNPELMEHGVHGGTAYAAQERSDYNPANKFTGTEVNSQLAEHGVNGVEAYGFTNRLEYNPANKFTGLEVNEQLMEHGVNSGGGHGFTNRLEYNPANKFTGQTVNQQLMEHGAYGETAYGTQERSDYNPANKFTGTTVNSQLSEHGVYGGTAYGTQERSDYNPANKFTGTTVNSELSEHGVYGSTAYGTQERSDYNPANKFTGTTVNDQLNKHGVYGGSNNATGTQNRKALTRHNRIALLKFMQGNIKSDTDGAMQRMYPTRFNTRKNTTNTVVVPSGMSAGLGGPETVERLPTEWSHRRLTTGHRPDTERIGAISQAVQNDTPLVGQFPVKFERDMWRMGPAHDALAGANATWDESIIRAKGPCVTY